MIVKLFPVMYLPWKTSRTSDQVKQEYIKFELQINKKTIKNKQ